MKVIIPIRRIRIKPVQNKGGFYEEFYSCPCGNNCINRIVDCNQPRKEEDTDFYIQFGGNCCQRYSEKVELDNENYSFILNER